MASRVSPFLIRAGNSKPSLSEMGKIQSHLVQDRENVIQRNEVRHVIQSSGHLVFLVPHVIKKEIILKKMIEVRHKVLQRKVVVSTRME